MHKIDPVSPTPQDQVASSHFFPRPSKKIFIFKKNKKCIHTTNHKVFAKKNENMHLVPPHNPKKRMKGIWTPRIPEIYCSDSLSLRSHRWLGWGWGEPAVSTSKCAFASPQETRRRRRRQPSVRPASDLTWPGRRRRPGPARPGVPGGRPAGGRALRRLGRAAGRRASCRGREDGGAAPTRSSPARRLGVCRTHTHPPGARGAALSRQALESRPQRGRDTPLEGPGHTDPQSPGP